MVVYQEAASDAESHWQVSVHLAQHHPIWPVASLIVHWQELQQPRGQHPACLLLFGALRLQKHQVAL